MANLWQCPRCKKVVDYNNAYPSHGKTQCEATGKTVQMVKLSAKQQSTIERDKGDSTKPHRKG